ncbi:MAG: hypothetical protein II001_03875 [Bacteroidales bacterium]|jgi:hypothetical protein|nr:hypothetical protein [Bacteroidales bacterium]
MRRPALIIILLQAIILSANAQNDIQQMLDADFSSLQIRDQAPDGANSCEKALYEVYKQLTGRDFFDPPNYMFLRKAIDSLGFFPGVFATVDRIMRDSKLGTATVNLDPADPYVHEGPEAYLPEKRRKRE